MTTILATIKPYWLEEILSGIKTEEVRKTIPKDTLPIRVLCCASGSGGQILCEFVMDSFHTATLAGIRRLRPGIRPDDCIRSSCVSWEALCHYMGDNDHKPIYFWHISNLIDYRHTEGYQVRNISEFGLNRPPQSWQYLPLRYTEF